MSLERRRGEAVTLRRVDDEVIARLTGGRDGGVIGVDGHSASGKTTFATALAARLDAALVHADDLAWHHPLFEWHTMLVEAVIAPFRAGRAIAYRPPAWIERGRDGAIEVAAGVPWLVVEGVACTRAEIADAYDATVWVQTPAVVRDARDADRIARGEVSQADYDSWMAAEAPLLDADRPWTRADVVVAGADGPWSPA